MLLRTILHHPLIDCTLFAAPDANNRMLVHGICFGLHTSLYGEASVASDDSQLLDNRKQIRLFLDGDVRSLEAIPLCLDAYTPFQQRIMITARSIPWGCLMSYSLLARMAGYPAAVRAAASVMRNNPFPLVVPCHRVVRKDGSIGGFMGQTTGECVELKKKLLDREKTLNLH